MSFYLFGVLLSELNSEADNPAPSRFTAAYGVRSVVCVCVGAEVGRSGL